MKYARLLREGDVIGVCAPSSGVREDKFGRLTRALNNIEELGYGTVESASLRMNEKCVSAPAETRAAEFMSLYENGGVAAIIPPWGGEFLMDMLPYLDFDYLSDLPPKWVCGYSDITTLTFPLTVRCDIATVHGSCLMNMGYAKIHENDLTAFKVMSERTTAQKSSAFTGGYAPWDGPSGYAYDLSEKSEWKSLDGVASHFFEGRMIGGCMDVLCKLIGTRFDTVGDFLEKYKSDGFIWTLESCEMSSADIYRTIWHMRERGWFKHCAGIVYGRAAGYSDTMSFNLTDALKHGFGGMDVPVIYDADIGHIPPQIQIVNGSRGSVDYNCGGAEIVQELAE